MVGTAFQRVSPVLSSTFELRHRHTRGCQCSLCILSFLESTLSLDVAVVGEEDELEEDDENDASPVWKVSLKLTDEELEEELVDKPGTTILTTVLRIARYPNPVFE